MNIGSKGPYPARALSNFSPHPFTLDGIECRSMEGFLQSVKFRNPDVQREVCQLVGYAAKRRGARQPWQDIQMLYWQGKAVPRQSEVYQELLKRAYTAMAEQSDSFRRAL